MSEMSEKKYEIRGQMDSAESLHVEIPMFVGKEDASCGNGGTMARKVTLAMCANLPVLGAQNASSSHKCDLGILCREKD